jgi:hypothetical protein
MLIIFEMDSETLHKAIGALRKMPFGGRMLAYVKRMLRRLPGRAVPKSLGNMPIVKEATQDAADEIGQWLKLREENILVQKLMELDASGNARLHRGLTPHHIRIVAELPSSDIMKLLHQKNTQHGNTAAHLMPAKLLGELKKKLTPQDWDVVMGEVNNAGETPLLRALRKSNFAGTAEEKRVYHDLVMVILGPNNPTNEQTHKPKKDEAKKNKPKKDEAKKNKPKKDEAKILGYRRKLIFPNRSASNPDPEPLRRYDDQNALEIMGVEELQLCQDNQLFRLLSPWTARLLAKRDCSDKNAWQKANPAVLEALFMGRIRGSKPRFDVAYPYLCGLVPGNGTPHAFHRQDFNIFEPICALLRMVERDKELSRAVALALASHLLTKDEDGRDVLQKSDGYGGTTKNCDRERALVSTLNEFPVLAKALKAWGGDEKAQVLFFNAENVFKKKYSDYDMDALFPKHKNGKVLAATASRILNVYDERTAPPVVMNAEGQYTLRL